MRLVSILALLSQLAATPAEEPSAPPAATPLQQAERRLAEVATLYRSLPPRGGCLPRTAVVDLRLDERGYVQETNVRIHTGEGALDFRLSEVIALAEPFHGLPAGWTLASLRFSCPQARGSTPNLEPAPPLPRIGDRLQPTRR